jgi:hypothetical protein
MNSKGNPAEDTGERFPILGKKGDVIQQLNEKIG